MNSRDAILHRLRSELAKGPEVPAPPVPEVWPRQGADRAALAARFTRELTEVHGEVLRCGSIDEARRRLAELIDAAGWPTLGAVDCPATRELTAALPPERVAWTRDDWQAREMASLPVGLVAADVLLADTGTCAIACRTAPERLMCYLPPVCLVAARTEQLCEHLPAAWPEIARRAADPQLRGEFVLVTGPSRTADIEKILILGAHGPKRLVVILVGD